MCDAPKLDAITAEHQVNIDVCSSVASTKVVLRKCNGRFRRHKFVFWYGLRKDAPSKSLNVHMIL